MQHAGGVEAVGVGGDAAHGVHADGAADHLVVAAAEPVGPGNVEGDLLLEGGMRQLGGDAADGGGGDAGRLRDLLGRVLGAEEPLGQQLEHRHRVAPVGQAERARQGRRQIGDEAARERAGLLVVHQRHALVVAGEQAVVGGAGCLDHQPGRVGVAHEVLDIDLLGLEQLLDHGGDEQPVGAGPDADPLVGDGAVAGAHGIDGDELDAALLELAERHLDGVGGVVLGDAEHQEVAGVVPVGVAELPERAAEGVHAGGRHVDRAEAAVGGEVGRAVLDGPPSRERLALVAAGEEGELLGIGAAHLAQPLGGKAQGLLPGDLLEVAGAALAHAQQRALQAGWRVVLHDAGRALAAQHALVDGMVAVALDVADLAVLEEHADAAAAGAHVAGGGLDLVGRVDRQVRVDVGLGGDGQRLISGWVAALPRRSGSAAIAEGSTGVVEGNASLPDGPAPGQDRADLHYW